MIKIPEHGNSEDWVMCQHSGTVLYASKKWGNPVGKNIAILGQGGIGISFAMIAAMQGAKSIICIDHNQSRLDYSKEFGSTHFINASNENVEKKVAEITNGEMADIVVEATGSSSGLNECIDLVKKKGKIIVFGLTQDELVPINQNKFLSKNCLIESTLIMGTSTPLKEIREMISAEVVPSKVHNSDYCLYDKETQTHYLIELKIGGDLDNKKARSEKEAILEQYAILISEYEEQVSNGSVEVALFFATAYNKDALNSGSENWKQGSVISFFAPDELLIGKDFWNFVCDDEDGWEVITSAYKENSQCIANSLQKVIASFKD